MRDRSTFSRLAKSAAQIAGRPKAFGTAVTLILVWAITGPLFGFSDTWQLVVNTGTTIVTFLMVFLIQNTQNRDTEAMQIKLDELIRATANANNELLNLEELDQSKLDAYRQKYLALAAEARDSVKRGRPDTTPET
ncbi:MAG TPA: low affinity iron permease family protein [Steroidobacteraceae bacterium]|nr:low affinity iron permease family protein [Steroidobacteraceae bacterium]